MKQTWRWFGPDDTVSLAEVRQTGATGIVTALHHVLTGTAWSPVEIATRKAMIEAAGLTWDVIESLPVSEAIKTQGPDHKAHLEAWRQSLRHIADAGLQTVCYNFMPILDWTRTNIAKPMTDGATAMHFDLVDFASFDLHILERAGAKDDFGPALREAAAARFAALSNTQRAQLVHTVIAGLPGTNDGWTLDDLRARLATYDGITPARLRQNLIDFLGEVAPLAEELGLRLCCHPDDPPFPLLGLPRVMSTTDDYAAVLDAVDLPANGATFCTGSLGVMTGFDPVDFINRLGARIHFVHLRNTRRDGVADGARVSFHEAQHLDGDTDMVATIGALLAEQRSRKAAGRSDWEIPMRPDHGQAQLSDFARDSAPGYPLIGRMRGLAELRGVMTALGS